MSERTPYERLRELHATLSEQSTATVDEEDRDAIGTALRVAEQARADLKTSATEAALAVFFGRDAPPRAEYKLTEAPIAATSAWRRWWDLTNSWPIALVVTLLVIAVVTLTMWVTRP